LTVNGMDGWRLKLRTRLTFFKIQFESIWNLLSKSFVYFVLSSENWT
jgi:hypothetical protein